MPVYKLKAKHLNGQDVERTLNVEDEETAVQTLVDIGFTEIEVIETEEPVVADTISEADMTAPEEPIEQSTGPDYDALTVAELDVEHDVFKSNTKTEIEGWASMKKADKIAAIKAATAPSDE